MRSFYKCVDIIRERLANNDRVSTVMFGAFSEADYQKKNLYPLGVINPIGSGMDDENVITFDFEIGVMDVRDLSDDEIVDKFYSNDNEIDNLNTCHYILSDLIQYLKTQFNDDNIELTTTTQMTPIIFDGLNILDGWSATITLQIPNPLIVC